MFNAFSNIKALFVFRIVALVLTPASISLVFWYYKSNIFAISYAILLGGGVIAIWLLMFPSLVEVKLQDNTLSIETESDDGTPSVVVDLENLADYRLQTKLGGIRKYLLIVKKEQNQFLQSKPINISFLGKQKRSLLLQLLNKHRNYPIKW